MFEINRKTDYAIRVLLALARQPAGSRLPTQRIQMEMLVPRAFLQRIIAELARAGLIRTFAGPHGGLELARPAAEITLLQIWEAMEGSLLISACLAHPAACPLDQGCPVHRRWRRIQNFLLEELGTTTLEQLGREARLLAQPAVSGAVPAERLRLTGETVPVEVKT